MWLTERACHELVPILAIPVNTINLGVMCMNRRDGQRAFPVVPDVHYFAVGGRDEMIMPSVPFHLRPGGAPVTKTHDRSVKASKIPSAYAGVHGDGGHQVGIECMPVDICDGARMGVERLEERPRSREVPHEQFLGRGGEDEVGRGWMRRPLDTALHQRRPAATARDVLCRRLTLRSAMRRPVGRIWERC